MSEFLDEHETVAKLNNNLDDPLRHNVAGPLNRPTAGMLAGREEKPLVIEIGVKYFDKLVGVGVIPLQIYDGKIQIEGCLRSCPVAYAEQNWELL